MKVVLVRFVVRRGLWVHEFMDEWLKWFAAQKEFVCGMEINETEKKKRSSNCGSDDWVTSVVGERHVETIAKFTSQN